MEQRNIKSNEAWKYLTDLLRITIYCNSEDEIKELFMRMLLSDSTSFTIIRLKPRFTTYLRDMIINFNWQNKMICECQIKLGQQPFTFNDQHFLYEAVRVIKSRSLFLFVDCINNRVKNLFLSGNLVGFDDKHNLIREEDPNTPKPGSWKKNDSNFRQFIFGLSKDIKWGTIKPFVK